MKFILLFLVLFSTASASALTFEECQKILRAHPELKPFSLNLDEVVFSEDDLNTLRLLFAKYESFSKKYEMRRSTVLYNNPFDIDAHLVFKNSQYAVDEETPRTLPRLHIENQDYETMLRLLLQLFNTVNKQSLEHPLLKDAIAEHKKLYITFFGIRYFLSPGMQSNELPLHRDEGLLQAVVGLYRPKDLIGGYTTVAWPETSHESMIKQYAPEDMQAQTWTPEAPLNRLLIFDGFKAFHGTTPFDMTNAKQHDHRDVVGMTISISE